MSTAESALRRSLAPRLQPEGQQAREHETGAVLTLDPAFAGLPDTAHGGAVLAALDVAAGAVGPRRVAAVFRRKVPIGTPLGVSVAGAGETTTVRVEDATSGVLVEGRVGPAALAGHAAAFEEAGGDALPVSGSCFACGVDNPLGLRARLRFDARTVSGRWHPPPRFRRDDGTLAPLALTALLDEAAFWLGALATGESGMTTDLGVTLASVLPFGDVIVGGERAAVRPAGDRRYWLTRVAAWDAAGRPLAAAEITFVAIRGAARRLVSWVKPHNPPDVLAQVFPAYAP